MFCLHRNSDSEYRIFSSFHFILVGHSEFTIEDRFHASVFQFFNKQLRKFADSEIKKLFFSFPKV